MKKGDNSIMEEYIGEKERRYFRLMTTVNQISSMVAFLPPLFALLFGIRIIDYIILVAVQIAVLIALSSYKYIIEKRYREIEAPFPRYVLGNTLSYALVSISLPIFIFLIDFFYRLDPAVRVVTINVLFVIGLIFLLSNLPSSRLKRISKPLEDPYLKQQAEELSGKLGTGKLDIFVMDLDKFKIANAGQVGARKYSVFISNYLLANLTPEENVAVIAHEFAHAKQKHVLKNAITAWLITVVAGNMLILPVDIGLHPILAFVFPGVGFFIILLASVYLLPAIQRHYETEADLIASDMVNGEHLISALEKITKLNLTPGDLSKYWNMDHPSTKDRVRRIREHILKRKVT